MYLFTIIVVYGLILSQSEGIELGTAFTKNIQIGKYKVIVESAKSCRVRYKKQVAKIFLDVKAQENGKNFVVGNFTRFEDGNERVTNDVTIWMNKNNTFRRVFKKTYTDICDCDICIRKIYSRFLAIERINSRCHYKKGTKTFVIDPDEYLHTWIGDLCFIGKLKLKMEYASVKATCGCGEIILNTIQI